RKLDDYTTPRPDFDPAPDLDELDTHPINPPIQQLFEDHFVSQFHPLRSSVPHPDDDMDLPGRLPALPMLRPSGGGGGGGVSHEIKVVYEPGGEQNQVQIHQINSLVDNDISISGGVPGCDIDLISLQAAQISSQAVALLHEMADEANQAIPGQ